MYKIKENNLKKILKNNPIVKISSGEFIENKNNKFNYKLYNPSSSAALIIRLAINLKININESILIEDNIRIIESSYLTQKINNLWVGQSNLSGYAGHISNTLKSFNNGKKYSEVTKKAYDVINKMKINVIDYNYNVIEITKENIINIFNEKDRYLFIWFENTIFEDLEVFHLKSVNSFLKRLQEGGDFEKNGNNLDYSKPKGTAHIYDKDKNNLCFLQEEMSSSGFQYVEQTYLTNVLNHKISSYINNLISENGINLSSQKYWVRIIDNEINIIFVSYYLIYETREYNPYQNINRLNSDCLQLNNNPKYREIEGNFEDFNIKINFKNSLNYFKSMKDSSLLMDKNEFMDNINYIIKEKINFKKEFQKNLVVTSKHNDELLKNFIKNNKFNFLKIKKDDSKNFLHQENFSIYFKEDKKITIKHFLRNQKNTKNHFISNEKQDLFICSFFNEDLSINREKILSLICLDIYLTEISIKTNNNNRIVVELEKNIKKFNNNDGFLDAIICYIEDHKTIYEDIEKSLIDFSDIKEEDKLKLNQIITKLISNNYISQKKDKKSKNIVMEFKAENNLNEKKLKEQCESYQINSLIDDSNFLEQFFPSDIFYGLKTYNNIYTLNIIFDEDQKERIENYYKSLDN